MKYRDLSQGSLWDHLLKLSVPTMGGMLAFTIFNLTDTYFVSKLGTESLAAMGFTFPVVMVVGAVSSGMSLGAGSLLARAVGNNDEHKMHRYVTDGILLSILSVLLFTIIGLLTMDPVFKALGASESSLPLIKEYMTIWYIGIIAIMMPPVSDSAMRAMGDMFRPFMVMLTCAVLNIILDPILIFGWFGFPEMGIRGAALATVISRIAGMVLTLSFVHFKYGLLDLKYNGIKELIDSWREILKIGIPSTFVRLFPQLLRSMLTYLAAVVGGDIAVASIAAGTRIESFSTIISMSIGTALVPLVGQNFGAKRYDRVTEIRSMIIKTGIIYSLIIFLLILPTGKWVAGIFTKDPEVMVLTKWYLWIMLLGAMGLNIYNWLSQALNAIGKPMIVAAINVLGTVLILMPGAFLGSKLGGFKGMLIGLSLGQLLLGIISIYVSSKPLKHHM